MFRRLATPLTLLLAVVATGLSAGPAQAKVARCLPGGAGPMCQVWSGKVVRVPDGDTLWIDIARDGRGTFRKVRIANVQAMELTRYSRNPARRRGQCHAREATARLERLVKSGRRRVRITAQHSSSRAGFRLRRYVAVKIKGRWRDLGHKLIAEGHALWMADTAEWAWNERYNVAEQRAARRGRNLWNPVHCGAGPSQDVPVRIWVSWDPAGKDTANINGEWIKVQNRGATHLPLGGWRLRDAQFRSFRIPPGTVLAPGETATLFAGHGSRSGKSFFWGLDEPPFQNPGDGRSLGDGGYLFDPRGDLRAATIYPCRVACTDPNQGAIRVSAEPVGDEYVDFRNVSSRAIDLYGYAMTIPGSSYAFGPRSVLPPGRVMRVWVEGHPSDDTAFERHWGRDGRHLPNPGGSVRLETFTNITLGCDSWGHGSC